MADSRFTWEAAVVLVYIVLWNFGLFIFNTNSLAWKNCHHVSLVLVSNRKQPHSKVAPQTWLAWDIISAQDMFEGPAGTLGLAIYRGLELFVFLFTVIYGNVLYGPLGASFFPYFTNWTFVLFGLTGLLGTVLTAQVWLQRRRPAIPCVDGQQPSCSGHGWTPVQQIYHLLLTVTCSASIMLTIFYWFADYEHGTMVRFDNPMKHGVSALMLLVDTGLSRTPIVSYHLQVVIAYGTVYLIFLWCFYGGSGAWLYRALDWSRPMSVAFYFALPLLLMLGFSVMFAVAALREVTIRKCSCRRRHEPDEDVVTAQGGGKWGPVLDDRAVCELTSENSPRLTIALEGKE